MEAFMGTIMAWGPNYAPAGWAFCNGQLLSIAQNSALFALLGTTYGGDGVTTFGLPDLRGRVPIHAGQGPGLSNHALGQTGGSENVTLFTSNLPAHTHQFQVPVNTQPGTTRAPAGAVLAASDQRNAQFAATSDASLAPATTSPAGSNSPVPIVQPYLTLNFIICLQGIFPSRN